MSEAPGTEEQTFRSMIRAEEEALNAGGAPAAGVEFAPPGSADEPWVTFTPNDRVGLAFSGGGIRSATFNLGLLQGLQRLQLLKHIQYLATVSGGGYIGAWWSVWLSRRPAEAGLFPAREALEDTREPEEVRHLREFSNFLSPRLSFFESEMWAAVLAVLSAMLPALAVAGAVVMAALLIWLVLAMLVMAPSAPGGALGAGFITASLIVAVQVIAERVWCSKRKAEECTYAVRHWRWMMLLSALVACVAWWAVGFCAWFSAEGSWWPLVSRFWPWEWQGEKIWRLFGIGTGKPFRFDPRLFQFSFVCIVTALVLLLPRLLVLRYRGEAWRVHVATADRVLQRLLAMALVWAVVAGIWLLGAWLHSGEIGLRASGGAVASGGLFALLRNWFVNQLTSTKKSGPAARLKPLLPQLLAYAAVLLGIAGVAAGIAFGVDEYGWGFWLGALLLSGAVLLFCNYFFDPTLVSMHGFYRNRLARAYLGASNRDREGAGPNEQPDATLNRQSDLRRHDDCFLYQLHSERKKEAPGPLHVVCCAANNLAGDTLGTLARGSRSAVLSPLGFAIGDHWSRWAEEKTAARNVTVASAITASAAAFNSNMGSLSMSLGPAVTFLMTALNLRLGLWLKHPLVAGTLGKAPGWLFFCEMFSMTRAGKPAQGRPQSHFVHLSDGAHFENLALYELVRRHCRYIIVSDCGADATVAFDDFGNAMRRIREDFGVEIDIDLAPLRPDAASGLSRQHMVAGTIYYDREHADTGVLLYLKPTLTGDEPCDVKQYRTRNTHFPHESTGDQFYDEAQWESYRCLGEHAVRSALRFVERMGPLGSVSADAFFATARQEWYQGPADLEERVVDAMDRVGALEERLREMATDSLRRELFPEIEQIGHELAEPAAAQARPAAADPPSAAEIERNLPIVLEVFRIMQSIWLNCHLDTHSSHPLNLGLLNLFQRWAYAPSCRLWWPLLRPMHGSRFRRFMEEHLALRDKDHPEVEGEVRGPFPAAREGLAWMHWLRSRPPKKSPPPGSSFYEYVIGLPVQLDGPVAGKVVRMQLGVAAVQIERETATWSSDDLYVPPSLWGSGTGGLFLEKLVVKLRADGIEKCVVKLAEPEPDKQRSDFSSRQERNDLIAFYKRARFSLDNKTGYMVRVAL